MANGKTQARHVARLLREAAGFFHAIGDRHAPLSVEMEERRRAVLGLAASLDKAPAGESGAARAAGMMRDAARSFDRRAAQDTAHTRYLTECATLFRHLADLAEAPDEDGPDGPAGERDPQDSAPEDLVTLVGQPGRYRAPVPGMTLPCAGQPVPPWMVLDARRPDLAQMKSAALARDLGTCRFCGFRSGKYQTVLAPSGEPALADCVTACAFCAQVFALDDAATMRSGALVWLPEMEQAALNRWMPVVYAARISGAAQVEARQVLEVLLERRRPARILLGTDTPGGLADLMLACAGPAELRALRARIAGIRLLPLDRRLITESDLVFNQFPQILAYWRGKDGPLSGLLPRSSNREAFARLVRRLAPAAPERS